MRIQRKAAARQSRNQSSAELHSAVSPICNRQDVGAGWISGAGERYAECNSAIQQIKNLRYGKSSQNATAMGDSTKGAETQRIEFVFSFGLASLHCNPQESSRAARIFQERGQPCPPVSATSVPSRGQSCPRSFGCGSAAPCLRIESDL